MRDVHSALRGRVQVMAVSGSLALGCGDIPSKERVKAQPFPSAHGPRRPPEVGPHRIPENLKTRK